MKKTAKDFPSDVIPCACCGTAIDRNSAAAKNKRRCLSCVDDRGIRVLFQGDYHKPELCAQDRDAIIDLTARGMAGENIGTVTLPSGRVVAWDDTR